MDDGRIHFVQAQVAKGKLLNFNELTLANMQDRSEGMPTKNFRGKKASYPILTQKGAPSVPTKFQQNGYVETSDGKLKPKEPLPLGFSGIGQDTAGPGDYDPRPLSRQANVPATFTKELRRSVTSTKEWLGGEQDTPGPGQYNSHSMFSEANYSAVYDDGATSPGRRATAAFKSTVPREFVQHKDPLPGHADPGPTSYNIPSYIQPRQLPKALQCFSSTSTRFQDAIPRSQRLSTAPGSYNPITSSFDVNRIRIQRDKRRLRASTWAAGVGFTTSSSRFERVDMRMDNCPSNPAHDYVQTDKQTIIPRRDGTFGSTAKRFPEPISMPTKVSSDNGMELSELALSVSNSGSVHTDRVDSRTGKRTQIRRSQRPRPSAPAGSSFFRNTEGRIVAEVVSEAPAVGSYDADRRPLPRGLVPMIIPSARSTMPEAHSPGPGEYDIPSPLQPVTRNRKNILLTTSDRFEYKAIPGPGPGSYDPAPLAGSLMLHSHNVTFLKSP